MTEQMIGQMVSFPVKRKFEGGKARDLNRKWVVTAISGGPMVQVGAKHRTF